MGSSAKTGKKIFRGSPEHFLDKNDIWDRTPLHLYINCSLHVWERAQGSQIFKRNSIISIHSKVMAFLVISLSPCGPYVVPVSSPSSPNCPHSPQKVPMWSPWLWSPLSPWSPPHVVPVVPTPCCPRGPHVVPMSSLSSPYCPCCPHVVLIAPRRSQCGLHGCGLRCLHPMLSLWSPCCPCHPHIVPVSSLSFPHHLEGPHIISNPPDTHSTHPLPPWGVGVPNQ